MRFKVLPQLYLHSSDGRFLEAAKVRRSWGCVYPIDLLSSSELDDGFSGVFRLGKLLQFPDLLPGPLEVRAIIRVDDGWSASAGDETFQGGQEVRGRERRSQVQMYCLGGQADKDHGIRLDVRWFAGVPDAKGEWSREVDSCAVKWWSWRCAVRRKHAHDGLDRSGVSTLAARTGSTNPLEEVAETWNIIGAGQYGGHGCDSSVAIGMV